MKILILNGPNLNILGIREPETYGRQTYAELCDMLTDVCKNEGIEVYFTQSNHEGDLVDAIQKAHFDGVDGIVMNPAAYGHTSIALRDAILSVSIPTVEVHLSDISKREEFRHHTYTQDVCAGFFAGNGAESYRDGILFLKQYLMKKGG